MKIAKVTAEVPADEKCQEPAEKVEAGSQRGAIVPSSWGAPNNWLIWRFP